MALTFDEWIGTIKRVKKLGQQLKDPAIKAQFKLVMSHDAVLAPVYENIHQIVEDVQD